MPAAIKVEDLRKRYSAVEALAGISFDVGAGEIFGLLGVNGAGKTTALECISGLREPEAGRIEVAGIEVARNPRAARARSGVVLPNLSLPEQATPSEALRLFGTWRGDNRAADEFLRRFGLADQAGSRVAALSQGQRQRLNVALACQGDPRVMLLDEPSNNLDPQARHDLHGEIRRMKADGRAVLLATHLLDEAEALCDRVAILDHGRIIAQGTPRELAERFGKRQRVRIEVVGAAAASAGAWGGIGVEDWAVAGNLISFAADPAARALVEVLARLEKEGMAVRNIEVRPATLEETFLKMMEEESPANHANGRGSAADGERGSRG